MRHFIFYFLSRGGKTKQWNASEPFSPFKRMTLLNIFINVASLNINEKSLFITTLRTIPSIFTISKSLFLLFFLFSFTAPVLVRSAEILFYTFRNLGFKVFRWRWHFILLFLNSRSTWCYLFPQIYKLTIFVKSLKILVIENVAG